MWARGFDEGSIVAQWDDKDWFRSSTWNDEIAAEFERRLGRARSTSRAQYIRIQGSHLIAQHDPEVRAVGRGLLSRVIAEYGADDDMHAKFAVEQLAGSLAEEGRLDEAEAMYRRVREIIARSRIGKSGTSGLAGLALAELLILKADPASLTEANELLDQDGPEIEQQGALFRNIAIRYLIARARVARALGDSSAATYAARALEIVDETTPSLPRHPDLGRLHATDAERDELTAMLRP
jgi:hypothetical protein